RLAFEVRELAGLAVDVGRGEVGRGCADLGGVGVRVRRVQHREGEQGCGDDRSCGHVRLLVASSASSVSTVSMVSTWGRIRGGSSLRPLYNTYSGTPSRPNDCSALAISGSGRVQSARRAT